MHVTSVREHATIIIATGELTLPELAAIAAFASHSRRHGRPAVVDVSGVTHLHYAGARMLKTVRGLRVVGASRYVRDLLWAGDAGATVEFYADVPQALSAP